MARIPLLLILHCVNQLKELSAVHDFDEGLALGLVADHINRRRVIDADALAGVLVLASLPCGSTTKGSSTLWSEANFSANPRRVGGVISG